MTKKQKKMLYRILIAAVLFLAAKFIPMPMLVSTALYFAAYVTIGYDILRKAWKGICNHQVFDENFLMAVATIGAIALAIYEKSGDYAEAVAVMLFYQIGELFQSYAVGKSRRNITALMDIRPDYANIERDGKLEQVDPDDVAVGTVITVQPGEKIPIDGEIVEGASTLNTAALTGESLPRDVMTGDEVISGCINMTGVLKVKTTKAFGESTVSKILELMENSSSHKSRSEAFISRFARVYTPAVCYSALALAILPPVINLLMGNAASWGVWIYRALTFLVISCPCALVISIPLSFFAGLGGAGHEGILIKGSNYLEALSKTKIVVFDKTGTLTKGKFRVETIAPVEGVTPERLLGLAAHVEQRSTHPIAQSICDAYAERLGIPPTLNLPEHSDEVIETPGHGLCAECVEGHICVGNDKLMEREGVVWTGKGQPGTIIHVALDGVYQGYLVVSDETKPQARETIEGLKALGVHETVMLTGDKELVAQRIASRLGIDRFFAQLLPGDKVACVEELLAQKGGDSKATLAFVGDGINDAPALARADVGIAMGAMGSDAAIEAADIVLMDDNPARIADAVRLSRKTVTNARENVVLAIAVKFAVFVLGALGIANMWMAVFADTGVAMLCVLNAMRLLRAK